MVKTTFVLVFLVSLVKWSRRDRRYQIRRRKALFAKSADAVRLMNDALKSF
jgi:hypothetical protein